MLKALRSVRQEGDGDAQAGPRPPSRDVWRRFRANRLALAAVVFLVVVVAAAVLAPLLTPYEPRATDLRSRFLGPSSDHWLGTDEVGRDVLTRILYAGRISLVAPVIATATAVVIGLPMGLLAGFLGGRVDMVLSRLAELVMTLPTLIVSIAVIALVGPGLRNAMVVYGVMMSTRLFRVIRAAVLDVRTETCIEASLSMRTSRWRILWRHVVPNIRAPLLVEVSVLLSVSMVAEASLSFLGLGVVPPTPSWGRMLARAFDNVHTAPFQIWAPGVCVAMTALAFNLVADGLRDAYGREDRRR